MIAAKLDHALEGLGQAAPPLIGARLAKVEGDLPLAAHRLNKTSGSETLPETRDEQDDQAQCDKREADHHP